MLEAPSYSLDIWGITLLQWAFGVTCWEVFNGGKNPYPGMNPYSVAQMIESGERLQKPSNTACSEEMYDNKTT